MYAAGILGMMVVPIGIFLRVYLGWESGMQVLTLSIPLIFFIYFPLYFKNKYLSDTPKELVLETTFYTLTIAVLLFFFLFRSVYPPQTATPTNSLNEAVIEEK